MDVDSHITKSFRISARALLIAAISIGATTLARSEDDSPVDKINAEAARAEITVQSLRGNISVLMGSGGNITVLAADEGKLLVDGGIAVSRPRLAKALAGLGSSAPRYLIDTHWHWDHTDSNQWLHDSGATIIAHENTFKRLSETIRVEDWRHTFTPVPPEALPTFIVKTELAMQYAGETIHMKYYGPSHTDSDIAVHFAQADVLVTGDTWWNGVYPFIDYVAGGSIDGAIRAANANIAYATDKTIVVPGHGPVGGRADLIEFRDMLVGIRTRVAELKKQGKSLDEVIAAKPTAKYDAKWGGFVIDPDFFTRLVYRGV
jgi:glyoxylase-like metal-dependent hydrolase (beta-lactamase superfamily II)